MLNKFFDLYRGYRMKRRYPGALISGRASVLESRIGKKVIVRQNSRISHSEIMDDVIIDANCSITDCRINSKGAIYNNCFLQDVSTGKYTYLAMNSVVSMTDIGSFCSIGPDLICGFGDHPVNFISTSPAFFSNMKQCGESFAERSFFEERKRIRIGHDVWIGARVFIRDGVTIGNGAIIGAGAVVAKDVPDYAIVGGVPAKIIRYRFSKDDIESLQKLNWWDWHEDQLRKLHESFAQEDIGLFLERVSIQHMKK